jgi:hypothetical protein
MKGTGDSPKVRKFMIGSPCAGFYDTLPGRSSHGAPILALSMLTLEIGIRGLQITSMHSPGLLERFVITAQETERLCHPAGDKVHGIILRRINL